jgi:rod shape-determining protein MreB
MSVQEDLLTGKPKQVEVSYREIAKALDKSIQRIEDAVMETLSQTPPISRHLQYLSLLVGGSMLRGLDKEFLKTDLPHCRRSYER